MRSQLRDDSRTNMYTIQTKKRTFIEGSSHLSGHKSARDVCVEYSDVNCEGIMEVEKVIRGQGFEVIIGNKSEIDLEILFRAIY